MMKMEKEVSDSGTVTDLPFHSKGNGGEKNIGERLMRRIYDGYRFLTVICTSTG
ncbi:unnamed protein product [Amoebophrya sp. A25]|nr:unnamed protein product [Amoebophrya sp. A25]|eukprot:GSA25T00021232001.1